MLDIGYESYQDPRLLPPDYWERDLSLVKLDNEAASEVFFNYCLDKVQESIAAAIARHICNGDPLTIDGLLGLIDQDSREFMLEGWEKAQEHQASLDEEEAKAEYYASQFVD